MAAVRHQLTRKGLKLGGIRVHAVRSIALTVVLLLGTALPDRTTAAAPFLSGRVTMVAWPAPIGHRQPRVVDIPTSNSASPSQLDMLDKALDRKLTICRGC